MELCSDGHDEVCFEQRDCPVCEWKDKVDGLEELIQNLEQQLSRYEDRISELESQPEDKNKE